MKTKKIMIKPVKLRDRSAVYTALDLYQKHSTVPFKVDLADYMANGFVYAGPTCFAMAKVIEIENDEGKREPAWFIRMAVGDIIELLQKLPFYLPTISFCRKAGETTREYSTDKLVKLAVAKKLKGKPHGLRA